MEYTFKLPEYLWGYPKTENNQIVYHIINIDKPIDSIDDFILYLKKNSSIILKYIDCDELIKQIENRNAYKYVFDRPESLKSQVHSIYTGITPTDRHRYEDKYNEIKVALKTNNSISCKWIYANQDKVFEFIDTEKKRICDEYKQQKKITNKTYYNLNKEPTERILLTEQEKKENKRKSNEIYYLKQKENKIETPKVLLTEQQKKDNKKKANEIYYLKKKNNKFLEKVFEIVEPNETKINFEIEENYIEIVGTQKKVITLPKESSKLTEEEAKEKQKQRSKEQYLKLKELKNIPNKSDVLSIEQKAVNKKLSQQKWKQKQKLKIIVEPVIPLVL